MLICDSCYACAALLHPSIHGLLYLWQAFKHQVEPHFFMQMWLQSSFMKLLTQWLWFSPFSEMIILTCDWLNTVLAQTEFSVMFEWFCLVHVMVGAGRARPGRVIRHHPPEFDEARGSHASCPSGIFKITMFGPRWEQQLPSKHFNNQSYLTHCWGEYNEPWSTYPILHFYKCVCRASSL